MINFILIILIAMPTLVFAKQTHANIYQSDATNEKEATDTFTAKVRAIREENEGVEVFFINEKKTGAYTLANSAEHFSEMLKALEKSKKEKDLEVRITADGDRRIKSVEKVKNSESPSADPNKKWDFGKPPE